MKTTSFLSVVALALAVQGAVIPKQTANTIAARQDAGSVLDSVLGSITGNKNAGAGAGSGNEAG